MGILTLIPPWANSVGNVVGKAELLLHDCGTVGVESVDTRLRRWLWGSWRGKSVGFALAFTLPIFAFTFTLALTLAGGSARHGVVMRRLLLLRLTRVGWSAGRKARKHRAILLQRCEHRFGIHIQLQSFDFAPHDIDQPIMSIDGCMVSRVGILGPAEMCKVVFKDLAVLDLIEQAEAKDILWNRS